MTESLTPDCRPVVTCEPGVRFGQPAVRGISCDVIGGMVWAGESVDVTAEEYDLTRAEVLTAAWFLGTHGPLRWQRRWRAWATDAGEAMWDGAKVDYAAIPDPPSRDEASANQSGHA